MKYSVEIRFASSYDEIKEQGAGMEGVSMKFVWQDISTLCAVRETFCGIHGPQFDISHFYIVNIFVNISDIATSKWNR
jgi:hypothetical protein